MNLMSALHNIYIYTPGACLKCDLCSQVLTLLISLLCMLSIHKISILSIYYKPTIITVIFHCHFYLMGNVCWSFLRMLLVQFMVVPSILQINILLFILIAFALLISCSWTICLASRMKCNSHYIWKFLTAYYTIIFYWFAFLHLLIEIYYAWLC